MNKKMFAGIISLLLVFAMITSYVIFVKDEGLPKDESSADNENEIEESEAKSSDEKEKDKNGWNIFGKDKDNEKDEGDSEEKTPAEEEDDYIPTKHTSSSDEKRVVAYFTSWGGYARGIQVTDLDPNLITHLNYAFANVSADGEVVVGDSWIDLEKTFPGDGGWSESADFRGHFKQLELLKKKYPHLKTLISIGGWTWSKNFSDAAATPEGRKKFTDSAMVFITKYGFDGIDIDWEYPVEGGDNIKHRAEDKENYTLLLKEAQKSPRQAGRIRRRALSFNNRGRG